MVFTLNLDSQKNVLYRQNLYTLYRLEGHNPSPCWLVEEVEGQGEASQEVTGRESQEAGEVGLPTVL